METTPISRSIDEATILLTDVKVSGMSVGWPSVNILSSTAHSGAPIKGKTEYGGSFWCQVEVLICEVFRRFLGIICITNSEERIAES
jgi:hypothetical protein